MPGSRKRKTKAASNSEGSQDSKLQVYKPEAKYVPRFGSNKRAKLILHKSNGNNDNLNQEMPLTQPISNSYTSNEDNSQAQSITLTQIPVPLTQPVPLLVHQASNDEMSDCDYGTSETVPGHVPDRSIPATQPIWSATEEANIAVPATQPACATNKKLNTTAIRNKQLGWCSAESISSEETTRDELSVTGAQDNQELNTCTCTSKTAPDEDCSSTSEKQHNEYTPQIKETIPGFTLSQVASQLNSTTTDLKDRDVQESAEQKNLVWQSQTLEGSTTARLQRNHNALIQQENTLENVDNKCADVEEEVVQVDEHAHVTIKEALVEEDSRNLSLLNPFNDDNEFEEAEEESVTHASKTAATVVGHDSELSMGFCNHETHFGTVMQGPHEDATLPCTQQLPVVPHDQAHGTSPLMEQDCDQLKQDCDQLKQPSQEEIKAVQEMMDLTAADLLESQHTGGRMSPLPPPVRIHERDGDCITQEGSKMLCGLIEELSTMNQFLVRCKRELECARRQRTAWIKSQGQRKV